MGHDIIINGVPINEDAMRELLEMLQHQNTSDGRATAEGAGDHG